MMSVSVLTTFEMLTEQGISFPEGRLKNPDEVVSTMWGNWYQGRSRS